MGQTVATLEDIERMKNEIIEALKENNNQKKGLEKKWIRSKEAREMLSISSGKLQDMRIKGDIPYTAIGSIYYYPVIEIQDILDGNLRGRE